MFLGCLYLGPLLFPLLLKAEIVTCFLFNCFAVKLQSLLFRCLFIEEYCLLSFHHVKGQHQKKPSKFLRTALGKPNISLIWQPRLKSTQEQLDLNSCWIDWVSRVSSVLLLRISWPFCFGNISHTFFLPFSSNSVSDSFLAFFVFITLAIIYWCVIASTARFRGLIHIKPLRCID